MYVLKSALFFCFVLCLMACDPPNNEPTLPDGNSPITANISPCDDGIDLSLGDLPQAIQDYLTMEYPGIEIDDIEAFLSDGETVYGVELDNDLEILFDADGLVISSNTDDDEDNIPVADLPAVILDYVATNYPDATITQANWEWEYGQQFYEVYLNDTLELYFDSDGLFLCEDDHGEDDNDDGSNDDGEEDDDDNNDDNGNDDNNNSDNINPDVLDLINDYVSINFANYVIESVEYDDWCDDQPAIEVELEPGSIDLYFSLDGTFLFSSVDISVNDLPAAVMMAINTEYPSYSIEADDVEQLTFADGSLGYEVELEQNDDDRDLIFAEDGSIICGDEDY